jgi:two-component system, response regulator, stage 0 sporulation protein F
MLFEGPMGRVLVAEDDPEMRHLVVEALRKDGHEVTEAAAGERLIACVAELCGMASGVYPIDVVVTDVRMPGCNGLDLLEGLAGARIRARFVVMTAFGDAETHRRAEALGAVVFDKPLAIDALRAQVQKAVRR